MLPCFIECLNGLEEATLLLEVILVFWFEFCCLAFSNMPVLKRQVTKKAEVPIFPFCIIQWFKKIKNKNTST